MPTCRDPSNATTGVCRTRVLKRSAMERFIICLVNEECIPILQGKKHLNCFARKAPSLVGTHGTSRNLRGNSSHEIRNSCYEIATLEVEVNMRNGVSPGKFSATRTHRSSAHPLGGNLRFDPRLQCFATTPLRSPSPRAFSGEHGRLDRVRHWRGNLIGKRTPLRG